MPFNLEEYAELRPFLYHVTDRTNLARLRRLRRLDPAAALLVAGGRADMLRQRREQPFPLAVDGDVIVLKDQRPLQAANVHLADGWVFGDLVEYLNQHVFFWPGDALTAIASGQRLLEHYSAESPAVLRVRFLDLVRENPQTPPLFCPYNSGAPRMNGGKPVPRGPNLFRRAGACPRRRHEVIEVGFRGSVLLPATAQIAAGLDLWEPLVT
jgi:hypothetical protein